MLTSFVDMWHRTHLWRLVRYGKMNLVTFPCSVVRGVWSTWLRVALMGAQYAKFTGIYDEFSAESSLRAVHDNDRRDMNLGVCAPSHRVIVFTDLGVATVSIPELLPAVRSEQFHAGEAGVHCLVRFEAIIAL